MAGPVKKPDWIQNPPPGHFVGYSGCSSSGGDLSKERKVSELMATNDAFAKVLNGVCGISLRGADISLGSYYLNPDDIDFQTVDKYFPSSKECSSVFGTPYPAYVLMQVSRVHCPSGTRVWNEGTKKFVPEQQSQMAQTLPPEKTPPPPKQEIRVVASENPKVKVDGVEKGKTYYVYLYEDGKNVSVPKGTKVVIKWQKGEKKYSSLSTDQPGLTVSIPAKAKGETITLQIIRPGAPEFSVDLSLAEPK